MIGQFIYFYMLLFNGFFLSTRSSDDYTCELPYGCRLENIIDPVAGEFDTMMCDVNNDAFEFKFKELNSNDICYNSKSVIFKWSGSTGLNVLDKTFNFANAARYFEYSIEFMMARFWNLNGIDVDIFGNNLSSNNSYMTSPSDFIELANSRLDFYHNKRKLNTCRDFIDLNITQIRSIFQLKKTNSNWKYIRLGNLKNNRYSICPLVFTNSMIDQLELIEIMDTFYKTNALQFTNETFGNLNSQISRLYMLQVINLNLDSNLLNPSVFENIKKITIEFGTLRSIDGRIFKTLKELTAIEMEERIFRKINHRQGIEWIKQINREVYVDLSNISSIDSNRQIVLIHGQNYHIVKVSKTFPDQDFCLYVDFPFDQLVIISYQLIYDEIIIDTNLSCTFLWLVQYYENYYKLIFESNTFTRSLRKVIRSIDLINSKMKCSFEERASLCAKSNYQVKDIWVESDYFILNKRADTYLRASIYPISILGIISNLIIIISILKKKNMKENKHLILISIFSIVILLIYLLSWMNECFYPYDLFCPEMRKLVGIQFFKIIFKECLFSTLRFMSSFTYIAFTLNRIGFISKLSIKKYIAVAFFISCIFSWIKVLKYQVNYFEYSEGEFPISTDKNAMNGEENSFQDFYFIYNLICDLINYFLLFMICLVLDLALVFKMRQRILDKALEFVIPGNQDPTGMIECETDLKKSIAMLVLNILIGVFFKLPSLFIPLINVIARFYYIEQSRPIIEPLFDYKPSNLAFGEFYSMLLDTGFYFIIQDICELLLVVSLPLQVLIYFNLMNKNLPLIDR